MRVAVLPVEQRPGVGEDAGLAVIQVEGPAQVVKVGAGVRFEQVVPLRLVDRDGEPGAVAIVAEQGRATRVRQGGRLLRRQVDRPQAARVRAQQTPAAEQGQEPRTRGGSQRIQLRPIVAPLRHPVERDRREVIVA